ncbi:MAG: methyl-accepting chemotaxis protein [Myxococcota bacterium]
MSSHPTSQDLHPSSTRLGTRLTRLLDAFIPEEIFDRGSDEVRRYRLLVGICGVLVPVGILFVVESYRSSQGWSPQAAALAVCTVLTAVNPFLLRPLRSITIPGLLINAILLVLMSFLSLSGLGLHDASLWWLATVPLVTTFLVTPAAGLFMGGAIVVELVVLYSMQRSGHPFRTAGADNAWFTLLSSSTMVAFVTTLAWMYEAARREALERLETALSRTRALNEQLGRTNEELAEARDRARRDADHKTRLFTTMRQSSQVQGTALDNTTTAVAQMADASSSIAHNVEALARAAGDGQTSVLQMSSTSDVLASNSRQMASAVSQVVLLMEQMGNSIKEVARNIDDLSAAAAQTSNAMRTVEGSISDIESNAAATERLSAQVVDNAQRGANAVRQTLDGMEQIREQSRAVASVIGRLNERVEAIDAIVNVIDNVARQTNLLALNAAIIATQAGEHGQGFAVVAGEIKGLAERTAGSTREIVDLIRGIQNESANAAAAIRLGEETVEAGVSLGQDARAVLDEIVASINQSASRVQAMAAGARGQGRSVRAVSEAVDRISRSVGQVAQEMGTQSQRSEQIAQASGRMRSIAGQVEASAQEQAKAGHHTMEAINRITTMVRRLHEAQDSQAGGSQRILSSIQGIRDAHGEQLASIDTFSRGVEERSARV